LNRLASVRFDRVLADAERAEAARLLGSSRAKVTSWNGRPVAGRTYALLELAPGADVRAPAATLGASVHEPALVVLAIEVGERAELEALAEALGGAGRPAGVTGCGIAGDVLVVELDETVTPLALLVDLADVVLRGARRKIYPLLGLRDESLAAFAGHALSEPSLDASRTIETWLDRLRPAGAAR
jgi:hypothetical protein